MNKSKIIKWLDAVLKPHKFHDASVNGLQLDFGADDIGKVAFAVDGSVRSVEAAAKKGAQLLVVHHGILWKGAVRRLPEGAKRVKETASKLGISLYASHLPLDANVKYGNNYELARKLGLKKVKPAFDYHGNVIGVMGENATGLKVGICSGGAGSFALEAQRLGCDVFITGEANWAEQIAAENIGMPMICAGHYETETFGVKALAQGMKKALKIATVFVSLAIGLNLGAAEVAEEKECGYSPFYVGAVAQMILPQGGHAVRTLGGGAIRAGSYLSSSLALEAEAAWLEDCCGLGVRALWHLHGWETFNRLFGYERFDPFLSAGARGWIEGDVGPSLGIGGFYYLTDEWALRFDGEAVAGVDGDLQMLYSISVGMQFSF